MVLLAVIKDKNKCLKAYFPHTMTPYLALSPEHASMFGSNTFLLFESNLVYGGEPTNNVGITENGRVAVVVSVDSLFNQYGSVIVTETTSWDGILNQYTEDQLLHSFVDMPYPAVISGLGGYCVSGTTAASNLSNGVVEFKHTNGDCYTDFGLNLLRPQAYTLDSYPGLNAHFGSWNIPGVVDESAYGHFLSDLVIQKDISCSVDFDNCIPIVNGLAYKPFMKNGLMYIKSATELFRHTTYSYSAVMLMDFSEFGASSPLKHVQMSDCSLISSVFNGGKYCITISLPETVTVDQLSTIFTMFDGRMLTFDHVSVLGPNVIMISLSENEIRDMRIRDMQLENNIDFNSIVVKLRKPTSEWISDLFEPDSETTREDPLHFERPNKNRFFFSILQTNGIYINDYLIDKKLGYNCLHINGNIGGMLQSCKGKEIFEHVIVNYMDQHHLEHKTYSEKSIMYGSDAHLIGYAPYEFITTLDKRKELVYNKVNTDGSRTLTEVAISETLQPTTALVSAPYVDRVAPDVTIPDNHLFRMVDIVKLK